MFKNKTDRLNYGGLLMPPTGYELNRAVATTYSLDLETLTAATIALGVQENTDSVVAETPIAMLRTLQKVTDKVVIFCESGQTKIPNKPSPLILLLDKMIVPVALTTSNGSYPSFHPKTWTIEYENVDGEKLFRFIVLSRNLTFDRSWDVSFMMEGTIKAGGKRHTKPLISFLSYLKNQINEELNKHHQVETISQLIDSLDDIKFELNRKEFSDFQIMPLGIGKGGTDMRKDGLFYNFPNDSSGVTFKELTIMSPFLSTEAIKYLNSDRLSLTGTRRKLFTRRSELPKIKDVANNFDIYVLKDTIIDGEESLPEGEEELPKLQDIHAKLYLRQKYPNHHLYLGSMNASNSGICRNVEMMIKLEIKNQFHLNMDKLCADFFGGEENSKYNPFEKIDLSNISEETTDDTEVKELEQTLKSICRMEARAEVLYNEFDYSVVIRFEDESLPNNVTIRPLRLENQELTIGKELVFKHLNLLHLSDFYIVTVFGNETKLSRVVMIPTDNIPLDRDKEIVKGIICDRKSFMEYVAMALGDDLLVLFGSEQEENSIDNENNHHKEQIYKIPALYEKMLRVAYEDKRRLLEIDPIMRIIDDKNIIPEEFREMYDTFKSAMKL